MLHLFSCASHRSFLPRVKFCHAILEGLPETTTAEEFGDTRRIRLEAERIAGEDGIRKEIRNKIREGFQGTIRKNTEGIRKKEKMPRGCSALFLDAQKEGMTLKFTEVGH